MHSGYVVIVLISHRRNGMKHEFYTNDLNLIIGMCVIRRATNRIRNVPVVLYQYVCLESLFGDEYCALFQKHPLHKKSVQTWEL